MKIKSLLIGALLLSAVSLRAQQYPIMACMTNLTIWCLGQCTVNVGLNSTNPVTHSGGMDLISGGCFDNESNVRLTFSANCCPTNDLIVAYIVVDCDSSVQCGGGQGGGGTCGSGGSTSITIPAGQSETSGFIVQNGGCCGVSWCQNHGPVYCYGQWPACNYGPTMATNNPPDSPQ